MNKKKLTEYDIVRALKDKLLHVKNNPYQDIWINKRLTGNKKISRDYKDKFGYEPVLQPEIDMIFRTHDNKLNAIEVKYLTKKKSAYNFSYYFGIGQALSLKRFGFDHVGLWLLLDESIPKSEENRYGSSAWSLIRDDLGMKLEYTYFKVSRNNEKLCFAVMNYKGDGNGFELVPDVDDNNFLITWKYQNEIKSFEKPAFMRQLIEKYICIKESPPKKSK